VVLLLILIFMALLEGSTTSMILNLFYHYDIHVTVNLTYYMIIYVQLTVDHRQIFCTPS